MANITAVEPIRYTQDNIITYITGLIKLRDTAPIDLTKYKSIEKITITTIPAELPSSVTCALAFKAAGGVWSRIESGKLTALETQELSAESLLEEGNTPQDLTGYKDESGELAGHRITYAIAMKCTDPDNFKPKIKLGITCKASSQTLVDVEYSPVYEYDSGVIISEVNIDSNTEQGATCDIEAQVTPIDESGSPEDPTEWISPNKLVGMKVSRIQYRANMSVLAVGTGKVELKGINTLYRTGDVISTDGYSEIISVIRDWRRDLRHCRVNVKHAPLSESTIKVYGTFRAKSIQVHDEFLGYGAGARTSYPFIHKEGIRLDSVQVFVDGVQVSGGFDVNCEAGQININAAVDSIITANYEYGYGAEEWQEMEREYTESFDKYDMSVYTFSIPNNKSEPDTDAYSESEATRSMAGIKIALSTTRGQEEKEYVGTGTGLMTSYRLGHAIRGGVLRVYADGEELSSSSYVIDDDPQYVKIAADMGSELRADYDWESSSPIVYEFGGVFSK